MEPLWAIIFKIWDEQPTYHRLRIGETDTTACGRQVGIYKPLLPMKHARKFGKRCRGCWPGG